MWVTCGTVEDEGLRINWVRPCAELEGSGRRRDECLPALRRFIQSHSEAVFGLDFPFGLPRPLVREPGWLQFVENFPDTHPTPEAFRTRCRQAIPGVELKRRTDRETRTPFSAYNLRLYRQTWFGIRHLLHPLVTRAEAKALPMQDPTEGCAWLLEICPASTLKRESLYAPYKKDKGRHRTERGWILGQVLTRADLRLDSAVVRAAIVDDTGGDALDSVVAAWATFRALRSDMRGSASESDDYRLEGMVYV